MTKICDFSYPIYDLAKNSIPYIYDRCGWRSCLKLKLWRAFVDVLIENEEKVASSKKYTQLKTRVLKPYPIHNQNIMAKIDTLFVTKTAEKPYPLGPHIPI